MLTDGGAVEEVMTGPYGALPMLAPGAVWIQMGTVGVEWSDRLAGMALRPRGRVCRRPGVGQFHARRKG